MALHVVRMARIKKSELSRPSQKLRVKNQVYHSHQQPADHREQVFLWLSESAVQAESQECCVVKVK